jgi:pimeloyl-ACP methyl ester carboxylesterase
LSYATRVFVLVHGAYHGGWCWTRVSSILRARGHRVYTPTLTGLGERSHIAADHIELATHIADIVNLFLWRDLNDVVLCGHSYGGHVVSGVAEEVSSRISSMVYLDALLPHNGDAIVSIAPHIRAAVDRAVAAGQVAIPPVPAEAFNVNEADRAWVDRCCTPHPIRTMTDQLQVTGAYERVARKTFVRALKYRSKLIEEMLGRIKSDRSWTICRLDGGHDLMIDMPQQVADILEQS